MTDAILVYQRTARINRATSSLNRFLGYPGRASGGITCSLQIAMPRPFVWRVRVKISFVWTTTYGFVGPKQQYSRAFRSQTAEQTRGSMAAHSARIQEAPSSTVQWMHQEAIPIDRSSKKATHFKPPSLCENVTFVRQPVLYP
jgi:hypothetical protein